MKFFILITIIISFCLGNEVFTSYSLNQNLALESLPAKPAPRRATFGILAAEFGGGILGGATGFVIGGLVGLGLVFPSSGAAGGPDVGQILAILIGGSIVGTFGNAVGTCIVGNAFHQGGRFLPTLTGAILGLPLYGIGSFFGSVIGYNSSRPKTYEHGYGFFYKHLDLPSFSFRTEKTEENKIIPVYDFRLINARF